VGLGFIAQLDDAEHGTRDSGAERWEREQRATTEHLRRLLDERPGAEPRAEAPP
jgi:hypothetical protein